MAWAAVDRAVRAVEEHGLDGPVERWRAERDAIHADVLAHGWDAERQTFVQAYGAEHTDAALLQIAQVGFLPAGRPAVLSTLAAIRAELEVAPGLLRRYRTERTDDGVAGRRARVPRLLVLARGRPRPHRRRRGVDAVLDILVGLANDVGLLAEQYDPVGRRMAGNIPQALSHLALVRAVHSHDLALERQDPMTYTGDVQAGGPADVRVLDEVVIRKAAVGPMENNAYLRGEVSRVTTGGRPAGAERAAEAGSPSAGQYALARGGEGPRRHAVADTRTTSNVAPHAACAKIV